MTRKDYIVIAAALRAARPHWTTDAGREFEAAPLQTHRLSCECVADALGQDNARFDRSRFLVACGVEG